MSTFDVSGFLGEFFDEANTRLLTINQKLVSLEAGKLDAKGLVQLRRDIHTVKGSAQMLGVQDISDVCHVFEDGLDLVSIDVPNHILPVIQFLLDLHDVLKSRLVYQDAKIRLDVALQKAKFVQLKKVWDAKVKEALTTKVDDENIVNMPKRPTKVRRKKKTKVAHNLIASIMGSIEVSLDKPLGNTQSNENNQVTAVVPPKIIEAMPESMLEESKEEAKEAVAHIDYRPKMAALKMDDADSHQGSGNFLRVDRHRLNQLSNQVVEMSSVRQREDSPEQQLHDMVHDFRKLKEKVASDQSSAILNTASMQAEMDRHLRQLQQCITSLYQQQSRTSTMLTGVRNQVIGLMLKPLSSVFSIFPRTVRDLSLRSGKQVQLLIAGESVEMDQFAAEALTEPLVHLINNAVAHGIEDPEARLRCGKPADGQITICASQQGNMIHLDVTDDGHGMDVDVIRNKAVASHIISQSEANDMDTSEILELVFHPGFSTLEKVTELAGRGMGMAIVLEVMRELTGSIHIHSQKGEGTCFSMVFPVSVSVQKAKLFRIANHRLAILANVVVQVMPLKGEQIQKGTGPFSKGYIVYEGHRVPIIDLHGVLASSVVDEQAEQAKILIVEHLEGFLAMVVDEVMAEAEVMIREVDPYLKRYQPIGLLGCSIIHDGSIHLIIEPNGLKEMWRTAPDIDVLLESASSDVSFSQHVLLVDDSSIALNIEKKMFEHMGFKVDTAMGGADALEKLSLNTYDLVVTDLEMPEIDGIALIQHLRDSLQQKALPIIVIATRELADERQCALDAGANAYLAKHQLQGDKPQLLNTLSNLLA